MIFKKKNMQASYSIMAGVGGILMSITLFLVFFGLKENREKLKVRKVIDVLKDSIHVFRYRAYIMMMLAYISTQLAVQAVHFNIEIYLIVIAKFYLYFEAFWVNCACLYFLDVKNKPDKKTSWSTSWLQRSCRAYYGSSPLSSWCKRSGSGRPTWHPCSSLRSPS